MTTQQLTPTARPAGVRGPTPDDRPPAPRPIFSVLSLLFGALTFGVIPLAFVIDGYQPQLKAYFYLSDVLGIIIWSVFAALLFGVLGVVSAVIALFRGERWYVVQTVGWVLSAGPTVLLMLWIAALMGVGQRFVSLFSGGGPP